MAVHSDAGNLARNHYDWFMPDNPTAFVDDYLDDFEAKMREALTDPFAHDMAQSVLPLIAAYRELRGAVQPIPPDCASPVGHLELVDGIHRACGCGDVP